jgi:Protein of unknown function (DUF4238)
MSIPRKHHFVPVCYLQQWCSYKDGKLYEFAIKHGKFVARRVGPRRTGFQEDLYSFPELPADAAQHLESRFLQLVDSDAAIALKQHLQMTADPWPPKLMTAWSRFLMSLLMRHPDVMSEFRAAAKSLWSKGGGETQRNYETIRKPGDPETFEEYATLIDPLLEVKVRLNLIISAFDNPRIGNHLNGMKWAVADVTASPYCLMTCDRPLVLHNLGDPNGSLFLPIGPKRLFVAANNEKVVSEFSKGNPSQVVEKANEMIVARARRYVYSRDDYQRDFIRRTMSTKMEPTPLFKDLDRYEEVTAPPAETEEDRESDNR